MTERFDAIIGAQIKEFKRKVKEVDREIRQLASGVDVDIDAATQEFHAQMTSVKKELKGLDGKEARVQVELAYLEFKRQILEVYAIAETLDDYDIDFEIDAITTEFNKKLLRAKALAQGLDGDDIVTDVKLNTFNFDRKYLKVIAQLTALRAQNVFVDIKVKYREFQDRMTRVATMMRTWGEIFSTQLMGSLIMMLPMLSPIISALVGLIGSLGVMIGVLAGQLLIMAAGISAAAMAVVGLGVVAVPTIKKLFDETAKLNAEQQKAKASWDSFREAYDKLVAKTEGAVLQAFTQGMGAAQKIMEAFEPLILKTADSAAKLMAQLNTAIDSGPIQRIFEAFNKYGAGIFEDVVRGIGNFVAGIGSLLGALMPAAKTWSASFEDMGKKFANWADGLSNSEKFQTFIAFVQENVPKINTIFGNLILGLVEFFAAFGGMGSDFMTSLADMMTRFKEWASALSENQSFQEFLGYIREATPGVLELIKNLTMFLVNMGIAMAPFGEIIMNVVNRILSFVNSLMETSGVFRTIMGLIPILIGGFMAFMAPLIGLYTLFGTRIVGAIKIFTNAMGGISKLFARLAPHIGIFVDDVIRIATGFASTASRVIASAGSIASRVIPVFARIGTTVLSLATKALPWLARAFTFLTGPIGWAIAIITTLIQVGVWLYKNWETVKSYAVSIWGAIANFFTTTIPKIYNTVVDWFGRMLDAVGNYLDDIFSNIQGMWNDAVAYLQGIDLHAIGANIIQGLVNGIKSVPVLGSIVSIGEKIVSGFTSFFKIKSPSRLMMEIAKWIPEGVAKGILSGVNTVKSATKTLASAVALDFSNSVNKSSGSFKNLVNVVKNTSKEMSNAVNKTSASYRILNNLVQKTAKENAKLVKETTKGANGKESVKYLKKTNAQKYEAFEQALNDAKKFYDISVAEERAYWLKVASQLKKGTAAYRKALSNAANLKITTKDQYAAFEQALNDHKEFSNMSLAEERSYWLKVAGELKKGTAAQRKALQNAADLKEKMLEEQYEKEQYYLEKAAKYESLSLRDRIRAMQNYMKQYKKGTKEYIAYEEQLYDTKKQLYNDLSNITSNYASNIKSVYDNMISEEKRLRDEFKQTYDARRDTLAKSWGAFDEVSLTAMIEYNEDGTIKKQVDLLQNMRDQVRTMSDWMHDLTTLEMRGIGGTLLEELRSMGPKSAAEIEALTKMTADELAEYQMLWDSKFDMAGKQATKELEKARQEMEGSVTTLRENALKEINQLTKDMLSEINTLVNGSSEQFNVLELTLPQIARKAMEGAINEVKTLGGTLQDALTTVAQNAGNSMAQILSGTANYTPAGIDVQSVLNTTTLTDVNAELNTPIVEVTLINEWNGEEVVAYVEQSTAQDTRLAMKKNGG